MKGWFQKSGQKGKTIIAQILKSNITIGELAEQQKVYELSHNNNDYFITR